MTVADAPQTQPTSSPRRRNQRRRGIIAVMVASLLASAGARYWVDEARSTAIPHRGEDSATSNLGGMNSFALGLLLGGLRGPLVMFLWVQSETQKGDKDLEGVDTQIEWIRLLQPEFDSVHIFQIWNKAYNISVQMASRANKYTVILGALDYARSVDREKPEDINILDSIERLYFDKLGYSAEKFYYRKRVREESVPHEGTPKQTSGTRTRLDPVCDANFMLLPELTAPRYDHGPRPAGTPSKDEFNTGAELQYLTPFQPFMDGVSPFAFAYNYSKRAEILQSLYKQSDAQLSDQVIDSRPAIACKFWVDEALDQGRRREFYAFGLVYPENQDDSQNLEDIHYVTARITPGYDWLDRPSDVVDASGSKSDDRAKRIKAFDLAIHDYDEAVRVSELGKAEYTRHILGYPSQESLYESHLLQMGAQAALVAGDRDFLMAMKASGQTREDLVKSSRAHYQDAIAISGRSLLKYYVDSKEEAELGLPAYVARKSQDNKWVDDMSQAEMIDAVAKEAKFNIDFPKYYKNTDRYEFDRYIARARMRVAAIDHPTTIPPILKTVTVPATTGPASTEPAAAVPTTMPVPAAPTTTSK